MTPESVAPPPPTRQYKRHSASQWEKQKPHIRKLYIDESKTLDEVVDIMKVQHDFLARYLAVSFRGTLRSFSEILIKFQQETVPKENKAMGICKEHFPSRHAFRGHEEQEKTGERWQNYSIQTSMRDRGVPGNPISKS